MRGRVASARANSNRLRSRSGRLPARTVAFVSSPVSDRISPQSCTAATSDTCAPNSAATERFSNTVRCVNGRGIWNERPRPARQRASGGTRVMSLPSRMIRPRSGRSMPVTRLNRVDFPAPFGPITPRASPRDKVRSMSLATTIAPNALEMPFSSSMLAVRHHRFGPGHALRPILAQRLHLAAKWNLRRPSVLRNYHLVPVAIEPPLPADQGRFRDVLRGERRHLVRAERNWADDGVEFRRTNGFRDGHAVGWVARPLQRIDCDLEQRVHETDWLRPLLSGGVLGPSGEISGGSSVTA